MQQRLVRTFIAYLKDRPGVLNRVISLLRRRGYNIDSLTVASTERKGVSRLTLVIEADDNTAHLFEANLYKLVDVLFVEDITHVPSVVRELAMLKVRADAKTRPELLQLCETLGVRVLNVTPHSVTAEVTSTPAQVDELLAVLAPFGVVELVRTGAVAITRSEEAPALIAAHPHTDGAQPARGPKEHAA